MLKRVINIAAGITGLALAGGCITANGISPEAMNSPPYSTVTEGLKPDMGSISSHIPQLRHGMLLTFFVTGSNMVNVATMDKTAVLEVKGAALSRSIKLAKYDYDIVTSVHTEILKSTTMQENIGVSKATATLELSHRETGITTKHKSAEIQSQANTLNIDTSKALAGIDSTKNTINIDTTLGSADITTRKGSLDIEAPESISSMKKVSTESEMSFSTDKAVIDVTENTQKTGIDDEESTTMDQQTKDSKFGFLDESMGVMVESDFDVIKVLRDQFILDGFYRKGVLHEGGSIYAVPSKEEQAFLNLLRSRTTTVEELLNRPFSKRFRKAAGMNPAEISITAEFITNRIKHHGEQVLLSIQVSNNGTTPVYDLLLLNRLPQHTAFERFPVVSTGESGFLHNFNNNNDTLAFKLYRPLMPGDFFKTSVILRLECWDATAKRK